MTSIRKQNMTDRINKILAFCKEKRVIEDVSGFINTANARARDYLTLLSRRNLIKITNGKKSTGGRCKIIYETIDQKITQEDIDYVLEGIREISVRKSLGLSVKIMREIEYNVTEIKDYGTEPSPEEKQGIYKLSSNPSKYFANKFKNQNEQFRSEYVSPKNYAGTSAGLIW